MKNLYNIISSFFIYLYFIYGSSTLQLIILQNFQAPLLKRYPANLSVTAYSYFFGAILMVVTAFFMTNETTEWSLTQSEVFAVIYAVSSSLLISYVINLVLMFAMPILARFISCF